MIPFERAGRGLKATLLSGLVASLCTACLVGPPRSEHGADTGVVRAERPERAAEIAAALDELAPRVRALLPGTRTRRLEVWVQDVPALYAFQASAYSDADGFFAAGMSRVHLREGSEHIERTLAHELVHASLGGAWDRLPGTLEEGLCDLVSAELCPDAAVALSTGRVSSAAFATGGLLIDLELALPGDEIGEVEVSWSARLRLDAEPRVRVDPLHVFDLQAGLSTSRLTSAEKRSYYGIAFVVVSRVVARVGYDGLYALCVSAKDRGLRVVPTDELLAAAGLTADPADLRAVIEAAVGQDQLAELVRTHPEFLVGTIARFLAPGARGSNASVASQLERVKVRVRLSGSRGPAYEMPSVASWRSRLEAELANPDLAQVLVR